MRTYTWSHTLHNLTQLCFKDVNKNISQLLFLTLYVFSHFTHPMLELKGVEFHFFMSITVILKLHLQRTSVITRTT